MLTGMEEEMFPYKGIDPGEREELEEERRLAYVAITRARQDRLAAVLAAHLSALSASSKEEAARLPRAAQV